MVTGGVSAWANTWEIALKVLFSFVRRVKGQGKVARMRMEDAKLIARGEVLYTRMVVEWEACEMTGAPQWRSLFADELVELKGSMELVWGETEEGTALLNPELVFHSCLVQIYVASEPKKSSFALVDHTSAFNCAVRELVRLSAIAPPLLGGHALLPTASIELTDEWCHEWEIWMGALLRVLGDAKEEGDRLEIPYDVVQAIATAEVAYTNLEGQAEADRARAMRGEMSGARAQKVEQKDVLMVKQRAHKEAFSRGDHDEDSDDEDEDHDIEFPSEDDEMEAVGMKDAVVGTAKVCG
ncbi:hypothetical protein BDN67DRAFT_1016518 [Paxillus ammoniavirescens]|nr:hypothetical protein BDN67DRAFT_1016518 [Paxillus ammoniavirescens]